MRKKLLNNCVSIYSCDKKFRLSTSHKFTPLNETSGVMILVSKILETVCSNKTSADCAQMKRFCMEVGLNIPEIPLEQCHRRYLAQRLVQLQGVETHPHQ
jgi:hypothetical protein